MSAIEFLTAAQALARGVPTADVYSHPTYGLSAELIDNGSFEVAVSSDGHIAFPYIRRPVPGSAGHYDIVTPYGYGGITHYGGVSHSRLLSFRHDLLDAGRERGLVAEFLRLNPLDDHRVLLRGATEVLENPTFGSFVNSPEKEWEQVSGRHRTSVRKAQRLGITVEEVAPDELREPGAPFRTIYDATMERLSARDDLRLSTEYYRRLLAMPKGSIHVLHAFQHSSVVASAIFLTSAARLHYHLSGATDEGRRAQATSALVAHAVETIFSCPFALHLGGGLAPGDGLARFKRSASTHEFKMKLVRNVVDPEVYRELCAAHPATNYFPAYRAPAKETGIR